MLPLIVILLFFLLAFWIGSSIILWLTGLIIAFLFFVVAVMALYAFHKMDVLDVDENRWLLFTPFAFFLVGLGLDRVGALSIKPLTVSNTLNTPVNVEVLLLIGVVALLVVDIIVSRRE